MFFTHCRPLSYSCLLNTCVPFVSLYESCPKARGDAIADTILGALTFKHLSEWVWSAWPLTPSVCLCVQEFHYRPRGSDTCLPCDCYPVGSFSRSCDPETGQCQCRPGVIGRQCNTCDNPFAEVTNSGCDGEKDRHSNFCFVVFFSIFVPSNVFFKTMLGWSGEDSFCQQSFWSNVGKCCISLLRFKITLVYPIGGLNDLFINLSVGSASHLRHSRLDYKKNLREMKRLSAAWRPFFQNNSKLPRRRCWDLVFKQQLCNWLGEWVICGKWLVPPATRFGSLKMCHHPAAPLWFVDKKHQRHWQKWSALEQ